MAISDKTRKILWARSGDSCAYCKHKLIIDATTCNDESVIGEECHIISSQIKGPRHDPTFPQEQIDSYKNLIVLCRDHHKVVDGQKDTYTTDILRKMKIDHEHWWKEKLTLSEVPSSPKIKRLKKNIPSYLSRLTSGKEALTLIDGACASYTAYDELETQEEVDIVGKFFLWVQDLDVINIGSEPALPVQWGFKLTEMITELEETGSWVFGARELRILEGGVGEPVNFPVVILRVLRKTNQEIIQA